jgi:hypothetical protein
VTTKKRGPEGPLIVVSDSALRTNPFLLIFTSRMAVVTKVSAFINECIPNCISLLVTKEYVCAFAIGAIYNNSILLLFKKLPKQFDFQP